MAGNDLVERLKLQALAKKQEREQALALEENEKTAQDPNPDALEETPEPLRAKIQITVSMDRLRAELELHSPIDGEPVDIFPTKEELQAAVESESIVHGIIEEAYEQILRERMLNKPYLIAKGQAPVRGADGSVEYLIDTQRDLTPKLREDGTVDFKQIGFALVVEARQRLCKINPPAPGVDGRDIFGSVLEHQPGDTPIPPTGRNTEVSEDGAFVIAVCSGNLNVVKGFLNVDEKLTINGDVDNSTGSINFPGVVTIFGDVREGFEVLSGADVIIRGFVEGAVVKAAGNITLSGINGMGSGLLSAQGDIKCSYVENATIICGGDISADAILNSNVKCKGNLTLSGRKGVLIGGECTVYGDIKLKNIGTITHIPTMVVLGSECDNIRLLAADQVRLDELTQQLLEMDQQIKHMISLLHARRLSESRTQKLYEMIEERKALAAQHGELKAEVEKLANLLSDCQRDGDCVRSILECTGTMHSGTRLQMSKSVLDVASSYNNFRAYLEDGEIKISM